VTGAASTASSPFNYVVPQVLAFLFLALTSAVGVWRDLDNGVVTLGSAWNITNTLILGVFLTFAARESRQMRREARIARRIERVPTASVPAFAGAAAYEAADDDRMAGVA
jgi:cellulose synthase (UDP-forming)